MPGPLRSLGFDRAERKFDLMQEPGADLLVICSTVSPRASGGVSGVNDSVAALTPDIMTMRIGFERGAAALNRQVQ
jgi:4-hydroxyphenylpyruvate dioxygenase